MKKDTMELDREQQENLLRPGWRISEEDPGYMVKTVQFGAATAHILRPILTPEEFKRREKAVGDQLAAAMRPMLFREGARA